MAQKFNPKDPDSILHYARLLVGMSFGDILKTDESILADDFQDIYDSYNNPKRRGGLGNLVEKHYFHYKINSCSQADFQDAKIELKVSPIEKTIEGDSTKIKAGERLVLTNINYNDESEYELNLFKSHLWKKCSKILLVQYFRNKSIQDRVNYKIEFVTLFTPSETDLIVIQEDYLIIMQKIVTGRAHLLSEGDTMYLGACTKGKTATESIVLQITSGIPAQKRAFCYKIQYMTMVLNEVVVPNQNRAHLESIILDSEKEQLRKYGFEQYLRNKLSPFFGKTDEEICQNFGLNYLTEINKRKALWIKLAYRMLGISSEIAEEFLKANIIVKSVRVEQNGKIKEHSSLPPFKFKEFAEENWDDGSLNDSEYGDFVIVEDFKPATLQLYLSTTKFFFVVFQSVGSQYVLKGCKLWNMPIDVIHGPVRDFWQRTQNVVKDGVKFTLNKKNDIVTNNLPKSKDNGIVHVRPHDSKRYYKTSEFELGDSRFGDTLPNGDIMPKQSFWINSEYLEQILFEIING